MNKQEKNKSPNRKEFLLIGNDPDLSEIVRKHSENEQSEEKIKKRKRNIINTPINIFKSEGKYGNQYSDLDSPERRNSQNSQSKYFSKADMLKQKKRNSEKNMNISRPLTPDYQVFEAPKCSNKSKHPRVELFFQSLNLISQSKYYLHIIQEDTKFNYKTMQTKKKDQIFKQTLKTKFIFEKKQLIQVNVWGVNDELLGSVEFELGQLIGSPSNCLILDLVGGKLGTKKSDNPFVIGILKNEKQKKDISEIAKIPKIKVYYGSLQPSVHEIEQQKYNKMFLDFLSGNMKIQVIACVDFTASNIHTQEPLHAIYDNKLNEYQSAIASICSILLNYDYDKKIPIYGFGAIIQEEGFDYLQPDAPMSRNNLKKKSFISNVKKKSLEPGEQNSSRNLPSLRVEIVEQKVEKYASHFFPLTGDWENTSGEGLEGVFEIYTNLLKSNKIKMSSPTLFSPMLNEINRITIEGFNKDQFCYTILLIMTDGVIHDMEETIEKVIDGSILPLSIIIIGLGCEDFTYMEILDSDNFALKDQKGRVNQRDIVQFVDYSTFNEKEKRFEGLAEEVLNEIPRQVCTFFESQGIVPKVPETTIENDLLRIFREKEEEEENEIHKDDFLDIEIREVSEENITSNYKFTGELRVDSGYLGSNSRKKYEYKKIVTSSFRESPNKFESNNRINPLIPSISINSIKSNASTNWKYEVPCEESSHREHTRKIREFKNIKLISSLNNCFNKKDKH